MRRPSVSWTPSFFKYTDVSFPSSIVVSTTSMAMTSSCCIWCCVEFQKNHVEMSRVTAIQASPMVSRLR